MKKYGLIAVVLLCLTLLSACGTNPEESESPLETELPVFGTIPEESESPLKTELPVFGMNSDKSEPPLKTEAEIQYDLEQSDDFWYLLAPNAPDKYSITDLVINGRITEPESSDTLAVTVTASSEYAVYTGTFNINYLYDEDMGYICDYIYQGTPGSYSEIKLPSDDFAKTYFELNMASVNGKLQTVEIEEVPSNDKICKMNALYESRDDAAHCTRTISAYAICHFEGGTWEKDMWIQGTSENTVYDMVNEIYWREVSTYDGSEVELINAYVIDEHQYYDRFVYYSYAEINYEDIIKCGFIKKETQIQEERCYVGCEGEGLLGESKGPIDEQTAITYYEQIKNENSDILIILDPEQYLEEDIYFPGSVIIYDQYVNEDGLQVVEVAHEGTIAYEEALKR